MQDVGITGTTNDNMIFLATAMSGEKKAYTSTRCHK